MKAMNIITVLFLGLVLNSCSLQQNPIADAPDSVKNGVAPGKDTTDKKEVTDKASLQIDAPKLVNFLVGVSTEFKITGRVLVPNLKFILQVENLAQFPGATFDQATGIFKWAPAKEILGAETSGHFQLNVNMITLPGVSGFPVSTESIPVTLQIFRNYSKPLISSVQNGNINLVVGNTYELSLELEDIDAALPSDFKLFFADCNNRNSVNIASAISYDPNQFLRNSLTGKYRGNIILDLKSHSLPYDNRNFCFTVKSFSRFGLSSDPYPVNLVIKNPLHAGSITKTIAAVKKGTTAEFNFTFFDPGQVGNIKVSIIPDISKTLPGSALTCENNTGYAPFVDCKLIVNATTLPLGSTSLSFSVQNALFPQDTVETNVTMTVIIKDTL